VPEESTNEQPEDARARTELGQRIRSVRIERGLSLREVGNAAGVSESFVSQVERGLASPSVLSLRRIAQALDVETAELLVADGATSGYLVRARDRGRFHDPRREWVDEFLTPRSARKLQINMTEISAGHGITEPYSHDSDEECILVLEGRLTMTANGDRYELEDGDALLINPRLPHSFLNPGPDRARVLWVMTPPSW
jgi:transcriptional regulator with XRE-family HTH domain